MAETHTGLQLIRDFFACPGRPVSMDEMKKLSPAERLELADGVAATLGYTKVSGPDGRPAYQPPATSAA